VPFVPHGSFTQSSTSAAAFTTHLCGLMFHVNSSLLVPVTIDYSLFVTSNTYKLWYNAIATTTTHIFIVKIVHNVVTVHLYIKNKQKSTKRNSTNYSVAASSKSKWIRDNPVNVSYMAPYKRGAWSPQTLRRKGRNALKRENANYSELTQNAWFWSPKNWHGYLLSLYRCSSV